MREVILDTNVFIRFLVKDIVSQFERAKEVFEKIEEGELTGRVSLLVINEMIWILENFYELKRDIYIPRLLNLLALRYLKVMEVKKNLIIKILQKMQKEKFDFTDLYLFSIAEKRKIFTFDKDFKKLS